MIQPGGISELVEAYRDGSIDREGTARLAETLRAGGGPAEFALEEVEFASLLHRALDTTGGEETVRAFFARMGIEVLRGPGTEPAEERAPAPALSTRSGRRFGIWVAAAAAAAAAAVAAYVFLASGPERIGQAPPEVVIGPGEDLPHEVSPVGAVLAGAVEVRPRGAKEFVPVPVGGRLLPGDAVRVGASGPAEINLLEKVMVVLDGGAEAVIAPDPGLPCGVRLDRGQIFAEVTKGAPFRVLTSKGEVRSLGTKFAVGLLGPAGGAEDDGNDGFAVSVEEGAVEVEAGGEVARVESGNSLVLERGCRWRRESDECSRRRLGWVEKWRGHGCGGGEGHGPGSGQRQGPGRGRGMHGGQRGGGGTR